MRPRPEFLSLSLPLSDKSRLGKAYGTPIGKARVMGHCMTYKKLEDIDT